MVVWSFDKEIRKRGDSVANEQNLIPLNERSPEERAAIGSKGGKATAAKKRRAKNMKEAANILLAADLLDDEATAELLGRLGLEADQQSAILLAAIQKARRGDIEAARYARDTSGQAPAHQMEIGGIDGKPIESLDLQNLSTEELEKIAAEAEKDSE